MKVVKYYLEGLGTRGFWLVNWCKFRVGRYISWWTCSFLVFQTSSFMVKSLSTMPLFITTCPTGGLHPRFVIGDQHPKYGWTSKRTMEQTWNHEPRRVSTKFQVCSASKKWTLKRHPRQFGTTCSIFVAWAKKNHPSTFPNLGCEMLWPYQPVSSSRDGFPKGGHFGTQRCELYNLLTGPRLGRSYNDELPNSVLLGLCVQHCPNNSCGRVVVRVDFGI
jgi:hypothetical protein